MRRLITNSEELLKLYNGGASQVELAQKFGWAQPAIMRALRRMPGYKPRSRGRRNQWAENHPLWKGDKVSYKAAHQRVSRARGNPQRCEVCGDSSQAKPKTKYDWANLTGKYHDVNDYKRMCRKCHRAFDRVRRERKA